LLALKSTDDHPWPMRYYARVGGVTLSDLRRLEAALCKGLEWRIHVSLEELEFGWQQICMLAKTSDRLAGSL
jgi:hypothetical protein